MYLLHWISRMSHEETTQRCVACPFFLASLGASLLPALLAALPALASCLPGRACPRALRAREPACPLARPPAPTRHRVPLRPRAPPQMCMYVKFKPRKSGVH